MSWLPAMMFMHILNDDEPDQPKQGQDPEEQYPTRCNAGNTPPVPQGGRNRLGCHRIPRV